jgi:hypothetical protein
MWVSCRLNGNAGEKNTYVMLEVIRMRTDTSLKERTVAMKHIAPLFLFVLLMVHAFVGCAVVPQKTPTSPERKAGTVAKQADAIQRLQRQVRQRDRRIAELTIQLEALKQIELETESSRQSNRRPVHASEHQSR